MLNIINEATSFVEAHPEIFNKKDEAYCIAQVSDFIFQYSRRMLTEWNEEIKQDFGKAITKVFSNPMQEAATKMKAI